jgi:hypothetical protein
MPSLAFSWVQGVRGLAPVLTYPEFFVVLIATPAGCVKKNLPPLRVVVDFGMPVD